MPFCGMKKRNLSDRLEHNCRLNELPDRDNLLHIWGRGCRVTLHSE